MKTSESILRTFQIGDYAQAYDLWSKTEGVGLTPSDTQKEIAYFLRRNPDLSMVAVQNDQIVGTALCGHDGRRAAIYHLAVAPQARRHGLGQALVDRCMANLAHAGIQKCRIFYFTSNTTGESFWRHRGWTTRAELGWKEKPTSIDSK